MKTLVTGLVIISCFVMSGAASAAFVLGATRVVYQQGDEDVTLSVRNTSSLPYVGQAWVEPYSVDPEGVNDEEPPSFVVTPSLFKLEPGDAKILRFIGIGTSLPTDRESTFWINVQEIPPEAKGKNVVQFAQRIKVKLFYRPDSIVEADTLTALSRLRVSISGDVLKVENPSPFSVSFFRASLLGSDDEAVLPDLRMALPFSSVELRVPEVGTPERFSFDYINDYGGRRAGPDLEVR